MGQIYLTLYNSLWIKVDTDNTKILDKIKDHFSFFVENYWFMPKYKSGMWDGRLHIFDYKKRLLPYGLLFDLIKLLKKHKYEIKISDEVRFLYGSDVNLNSVNYDLSLTPRYYQDDIIKECLKYKKGCFLSPTASGKSYSISCLIKILIDSNKIKNSLIIVPTTGLILQFYKDMIDYGMDESLLGEFYAEKKDWNKPILISTWQSLTHNNEKLRKSELNTIRKELKKKKISKEEKTKLQKRYDTITSREYTYRIKEFMEYKQILLNEVDCVIVDEAQGVKSTELLKLMQKIKNAEWRFGCTGTFPQSKIDMANIKSYIGPVIKRYTVKELTDAGYLNPCSIHISNLYYSEKITGKLEEVKDKVFESKFRKQFIRDKIYNTGNENFLILVGRIEKEGMLLEKYLKEQFPEKQIKFIHGKIKAKDREYWRQKCINENNVILIAVYQLFQQGINIPNLSYVMFGSSYKAKIRTLQSIGRSLRKSKGKKESVIIDIIDNNNKYLPKQAKERMKYYTSEEFDMIEEDYIESEYNCFI